MSSFATVGATCTGHIRRRVRAGFTMARIGILSLFAKLKGQRQPERMESHHPDYTFEINLEEGK
jgi:hypothetical protein